MTLVLLLLQTAGLLGPSFFGWIAPGLYARLFPLASLPALNELSQIGLVLFMFMVRLPLDRTEVYAPRRLAGLASLLSIAVPFALGLALARPLHILAPSSPKLPFSLLIAISMSNGVSFWAVRSSSRAVMPWS